MFCSKKKSNSGKEDQGVCGNLGKFSHLSTRATYS